MIRKEYEIVETLSREFNIKSLCIVMNVSRSGYYKWLNRKGEINNYKKNRNALAEEIKNIHKHHSTYGYRSIAQHIRNKTGWIFSDNLCHKVCKSLNIRSKARKTYVPRGEESITYPNIVNGNFKPTRPFEIVVSDTTLIYCKGKRYDWTFYIDVFNNEIISSDVRPSKHGNGIQNHFIACKKFLKEKIKRGYIDLETILHTDQGSVYSSKAFNKLLDNYTIKRSMSRAGTPTDHPVIESLNGWIKAELYRDFKIHQVKDIGIAINDYVKYFNTQRLAYSLHYKNPVQYRTELGFY